jgi:hypothetical protein
MKRILMLIVAGPVLALCAAACSHTYTTIENDELRAFWEMDHPLYDYFPLRVVMQEGQYAFVDSVKITYSGVECFVTGRATRNGAKEVREVRLPMLEADRVWMDMFLTVRLTNGDEEEYRPGFWYFQMQRGVPLYLVGRSVDVLAHAKDAMRETRHRYNDVTAVAWRSGLKSEILQYAVDRGVEQLLD